MCLRISYRFIEIFLGSVQGLGCNRTDDFSTPVSSGSNMSSIARFPKLDECAHFHYEHVELSSLEVSYIQIKL
ncbi:uncharacterized protein LOC122534212 isoform X1 [Frieseomelitta varia]|uniref:uncharacterized protein LOC122534212 isoform X1 n=1 Tax=Frieseomelitta varia TaxID=561572 RepID=UPI001CB6A22F|nr:uncharacterized protein LOC122534212 isoform X1 [Frieseomelitta varia]